MMKLSEFKSKLKNLNYLAFQLPDGSLVPEHFHVTEIGRTEKHFVDCGGVERRDQKISFQLWEANDYNHRLHPEKLQRIIQKSEEVLALTDAEIEVEYQGQTIETYDVDFDGKQFLLTPKFTDCLAKSVCGVDVLQGAKKKLVLAEVGCCTPGGGCC